MPMGEDRPVALAHINADDPNDTRAGAYPHRSGLQRLLSLRQKMRNRFDNLQFLRRPPSGLRIKPSIVVKVSKRDIPIFSDLLSHCEMPCRRADNIKGFNKVNHYSHPLPSRCDRRVKVRTECLSRREVKMPMGEDRPVALAHINADDPNDTRAGAYPHRSGLQRLLSPSIEMACHSANDTRKLFTGIAKTRRTSA
jgi:hypothetical protein